MLRPGRENRPISTLIGRAAPVPAGGAEWLIWNIYQTMAMEAACRSLHHRT